jgi:hypothetical protein
MKEGKPGLLDVITKMTQSIPTREIYLTSCATILLLVRFKRMLFYKMLMTHAYSYQIGTGQLHSTHLMSGEESMHIIPSYEFEVGCCLSEMSWGNLLITGGGLHGGREVMKIDTLRDFALTKQAPMLSPRYAHSAVHEAQQLYVLGGCYAGRCLNVCERYVETEWEAIPPLPRACWFVSGVVVEQSLYALGGYNYEPLNLIQKLNLAVLTWKVMQVKLPYRGDCISCFKTGQSIFFILEKTLYTFKSQVVHPVKDLAKNIQSPYGTCYYKQGTLYSSTFKGFALRLDIGRL